MKTVNDIRSEFLNFFAGKGHEIVPSAPLVPQNDPTLMFVNAGMVPFKDLFTGKEKRDYTRATSSQKCVRAGGKHNDLENVGYTARHHTFFEMLGNFSFGDYFKEDAIAFGWEFITKRLELPSEKLFVTICHDDEQASEIWKKVAGLSDSKIIRLPEADNFWAMGPTGPCGPQSEIFYDHGEHIWGGPPGSPEEDGDRFIEIWNLVFMQYEQVDADTRIDLPAQSVDTGMGLERMAATLMGSNSNYDVDILRSLRDQVAEITNVDADGEHAASHKVIADHVRAAAFLMADGVMPSNEGRGYVLRRIMRRGMRHAHLLGAQDPLMYKLFPTLKKTMGEAYPELGRAEALITQTLESEEKRFQETLERGLKILEDEAQSLSKGDQLPGDVAFKLYDTYGFPLDLTQDALRAQEIGVDVEGFEAAMAEQKAKARAAWSGSGDAATDEVWFEILEEIGPTEFLGYESESAEAVVQAIVKDGVRVDALKEGEEGIVITNQTPFYAESGGQVGDSGQMTSPDGAVLIVQDTKKQAGPLHLHVVKLESGEIKIGDAVKMEVDHDRRQAIRENHTVTHLLHESLRRVLGEHVTQKGSLQDENRTRFDVSHPQGVTAEELAQVEVLVNEEIAANTNVETRLMPLEEARESGAMALFGEKYDDEVRVVFMGSGSGDQQFSIELCGGTHVKHTGEIEKFKITSESALSAGVRRLEGVTGARVDAFEAQKNAAAQEVLDRLKAENKKLRADLKSLDAEEESDVPSDQEGLIKQNKQLEKKISEARRKQATEGGASDGDVKEIGGVKFTARVLEGFPPKDLKPMADDLKAQLGSGVIALVATNDGKASIVVGVTEDLTDKVNAVDLVRIGSEALGGKGGGGRPDMAQAGGPNAEAANDAVAAIEKSLAG